MSKDLATIIRNVDVNFDINKASVTLPNIEKVSSFLRRMQFYTFIKNIDNILASFNADEKPEPETLTLFAQNPQPVSENVQQNLFTQAIKETVADSNVEYIGIDDNNLINRYKELLEKGLTKQQARDIVCEEYNAKPNYVKSLVMKL